ncbi:nucleotidyl transferase AbiEii/AbiGii toxin family protein [Candidatus Woesearchaeota archaeon]|nr:nucleotidyl transferase AbiEii/AbiGii toxin family protein [Candidatus Woesearchaeota archaeon]
MIESKLIDYLAEKSGIRNKGLIEKDFIIQSLLVSFSRNRYISKNFAFKGGTCLVKCYLGYFRFSEDLDFTFINQNVFDNKSEKEIRRLLSDEINKLIGIIADISNAYYLDFKAEKHNKKYVEFGGNNKFLTLKIGYTSSVNKLEQFIKIQINFVDFFMFKFKKLGAEPLVSIQKKEAEFLFPDYSHILLAKPKLRAYNIKEILLEKVRAILTRRGVKERDFVDVFLITKKLNKNVRAFKESIMLKTKFMLKYEKYRSNLEEKKNIKEWIKAGQEQYLLLKPLNEFEQFLREIKPFINELVKEILEKQD